MLYGDEADLDSIHAYQTRDTTGSVVSLIRPKAPSWGGPAGHFSKQNRRGWQRGGF